MFHLFLSIPAFLHSFPIAHYHNRYDMSPSYKYSTMTFDHLPYHSYYDEMGFNNYSAEDRAWRRSYYSMWHRNHGITTHGTSKNTMAATIIDTTTVDTIGATDIIVASGLISLAGSTVIIVIKNADISMKASLVQHIKED